MADSKDKRIGKIVAFVILILAVFLGIAATQIQYAFSSDPLGPRAFPLALAIALGLCAVWYWLSPGESDDRPNRDALNKIISFLLLAVVTTGLMPWIGFILSMAILCIGVAKLFGASLKMSIISGFLQAIGWWVLFGPLFGGNLPKGPWGF